MPAERYAFLLDAEPRKQIQVAKLGDFSDERYGEFSITPDEVQSWAANLSKLPGGRAPIDFDHAADKPGAARKTEAAGWITDVQLADGVPTATVEWTPIGEQKIKNKEYLFFSPTYGTWSDEHGTTTPDVLMGGALTNKPFLNMPTVSLSRHDVFASEVAPAAIKAPADSRPAMAENPKILEALGLPADADEAKALSAVAELKTEPKTLDAQAAEAGKVLLDKSEHEALTTKAAEAGALEVRIQTLEKEGADAKFDAAFDKAKHALDAKPETRESLRELFDANQSAALKLLASLADAPSIVPTKAQGAGGENSDPAEVPAGVDAAAFELDRKVQAHIALQAGEGKTISYMDALNAVREA